MNPFAKSFTPGLIKPLEPLEPLEEPLEPLEEPLEPLEPLEEPLEHIVFDEFIQSILLHIPSILQIRSPYYVKGGKAFNHYYPDLQIKTDDWDLVAINEVYEVLWYEINNLLGYTIFHDDKIKLVKRISFRSESYEDEVNGKLVLHKVKTIEINGNGVIDIIIVPEVVDAISIEEGIIYQDKRHLIMDVEQTYKDRLEKSKSNTKKKRGKQLSKLERSRRRYEITSISLGKLRRKKSKVKSKGKKGKK